MLVGARLGSFGESGCPGADGRRSLFQPDRDKRTGARECPSRVHDGTFGKQFRSRRGDQAGHRL